MATQVSRSDIAAGVSLPQSNSSHNLMVKGEQSLTLDDQPLIGVSFQQSLDTSPEFQKETNINYVNLEINE